MSQNTSIHMHLMYLSSVSFYPKYCIYYKSVTLIIKKKRQHVVVLCFLHINNISLKNTTLTYYCTFQNYLSYLMWSIFIEPTKIY